MRYDNFGLKQPTTQMQAEVNKYLNNAAAECAKGNHVWSTPLSKRELVVCEWCMKPKGVTK